jgi:hypothetical protein
MSSSYITSRLVTKVYKSVILNLRDSGYVAHVSALYYLKRGHKDGFYVHRLKNLWILWKKGSRIWKTELIR